MVTCVWETLIFGTRDWLLFWGLSFVACLPQITFRPWAQEARARITARIRFCGVCMPRAPPLVWLRLFTRREGCSQVTCRLENRTPGPGCCMVSELQSAVLLRPEIVSVCGRVHLRRGVFHLGHVQNTRANTKANAHTTHWWYFSVERKGV